MARRRAFSAAVWGTLILAGAFGSMVVAMQLGWVPMSHFTEDHHRIHDLTFAMLMGTPVVGMLAQLRAPARNIGGQLMALVPFAALLIAAALTNARVLSPPWLLVGAATLLALMFHPAGDPTRALALARPDRAMAGLVAIAAGPLLSFAAVHAGLQRADPGDHALLGHFGHMAAFALAVIGTGALASARPAGWRLVAWVAGLLPAALGLASLAFPGLSSALAPGWAGAAIAWGIAFIAAAELSARRESGQRA